jgi:diadenosine tetraphosphate (Ap4A) HIT family hydrolase
MQLMSEVIGVARALRDVTACHKLNIAALGNMVPQLHVHIIARFHHDAAWPKPVWGVMPARAYEREALDNLVQALRRKIGCE